MKTRLKRLTASVLTTAILISSLGIGAWAADTKAPVTKNETVYVVAGADGTAQEIIVSDWLQNHAGKDTLTDSSSLKDIQVVKGDATASGSGSSLSWAAGGEDVYYQGTSTEDLPVGVAFTYTLDGKKIAPEDLAGKSGKLTIRIQYTNHTQETVTVDGKQETMSVPFLMATAILLDSDCCKNIEVDHGMAENDGDRTIVMGYGMPGLTDSLKLDEMADGDNNVEVPEIPDAVEITADVTDFSMEMSITVASCGLLDNLDLTGNETQAALEDALNELEDATDELLDGTEELLDGVKELKDGTGELKDGAGALNDGAGELLDGGNTLRSGAGALKYGAQSLDDGVRSLNSGIQQIQAALTELDSNSATLTEGSAAVKSALLQMQAALSGVSGSAEEISQLVSASGQIKQGIDSLVDNISLLQQNVSFGGYQAVMAQNGLDVTWLRQNNDAAIESLQSMIASLNQQIAALQAGSATAAPSQSTIPSAPQDSAEPEPEPEVPVEEPAASETPAEPEPEPEVPAQEPATPETPAEPEPQSAEGLFAAPATYHLTMLASSDTAAQIAQLQAQVNQLSQIVLLLQANNASIDGTEAYLTGVNLNLAALLTGAETLQENYALLDSGISQLAGKLTMLLSNVSALSDGVNTLVTEYTALDDGTKAYTNGVAAILAGQQKVAAGSEELVQGSSSLKSGTKTLYSGTSSMLSGISELYDGTGTLRDGTVELDDGAEELLDGVEKLHDGMAEFKTDGIEKLISLYRDNIPTLIHRLEALQSLGRDYNNFSGIQSDAAGRVKFLIRTEGISADGE